jgi:hypothetical protein
VSGGNGHASSADAAADDPWNRRAPELRQWREKNRAGIITIDVDCRDAKGDHSVTSQAALDWESKARKLGLNPFFERNSLSSDRVWLICNQPLDPGVARSLGLWLSRDWRKRGLSSAPVVFPGVNGETSGLPGKCPDYPFWSEVLDSDHFVYCDDAINVVLRNQGFEPRQIPSEALTYREARADRPYETRDMPEDERKRLLGELPSLLTYLKARVRDDPRSWILIGAACSSLGDKAFPPWKNWASQASDYETGDCERAWKDFSSPTCERNVPIETLVRMAERWGYGATRSSDPWAAATLVERYDTISDAELGMSSLEDIEEEPTDWLWVYRLARGEMALLAGDGGLGKSLLMLAIAAAVTTGGAWPEPGVGNAPLGSVVILSAEDSPSTTIKPRLIALGADLSKVKILSGKIVAKMPTGIGHQDNFVSLQRLDYWKAVFDRCPDCVLLIIDPLPSYLGRGVNDFKNSELRTVIEPFISQVLRPAGVCLFANTHLNKTVDHKTPIHRIMGSVAYGNLARNTHIVVRDAQNPDRRFLRLPHAAILEVDSSCVSSSGLRWSSCQKS